MWSLYGWFCALMVCGSCFGVITWVAWMLHVVNTLNGDDMLQRRILFQGMASIAVASSWRAAFTVTYAIEFMCLSAAKLMVLDRMSDFVAGQDEGARKRWAAGGRIVMATVTLGNAVGLAANIAAAVHFQKAADAASTSSAFLAADNIQRGREYRAITVTEIQLAGSIASVQSFCEVTSLLLIVLAFLVTGVACVRRVRSFLQLLHNWRSNNVAAAEEGALLQRQMVGTTVFVFVAFLIRSFTSTFVAVVYQLQEISTSCPTDNNFCDASCRNVYTLISNWMFRTPEFRVTMVLISSPIALIVALWGMTSRSIRQLMRSSRRDASESRSVSVAHDDGRAP